jgi:hypothetical protein
MGAKVKTRYKLKDGQLFYDEKPTEIRIDDDYFYLGNRPLNIYQEDGHIYFVKHLIPFLKWPTIASPVGLSFDGEGFLWVRDQKCIFDQYLK